MAERRPKTFKSGVVAGDGLFEGVPDFGDQSFSFAQRAFSSGTNEVGTLFDECDIVYRCKVCNQLSLGFMRFLTHKRYNCRDYAAGVGPIKLFSPQEDEEEEEEEIEEDKPCSSSSLKNRKIVKKKIKKKLKPKKPRAERKRQCLVQKIEKRLTTVDVTSEGEPGTITLHTLPRIVKHVPTTIIENGIQKVVRMPGKVAMKDWIPPDRTLVAFPREVNNVLEMKFLRDRNFTAGTSVIMDNDEVEMMRRLTAHGYPLFDAEERLCLHFECKEIEGFDSMAALALHVSLRHNRPRQGSFSCFICGRLSSSYEKLKKHALSSHEDVIERHKALRRSAISKTPAKDQKPKLPETPVSQPVALRLRSRSLSPLSEYEEEPIPELEEFHGRREEREKRDLYEKLKVEKNTPLLVEEDFEKDIYWTEFDRAEVSLVPPVIRDSKSVGARASYSSPHVENPTVEIVASDAIISRNEQLMRKAAPKGEIQASRSELTPIRVPTVPPLLSSPETDGGEIFSGDASKDAFMETLNALRTGGMDEILREMEDEWKSDSSSTPPMFLSEQSEELPSSTSADVVQPATSPSQTPKKALTNCRRSRSSEPEKKKPRLEVTSDSALVLSTRKYSLCNETFNSDDKSTASDATVIEVVAPKSNGAVQGPSPRAAEDVASSQHQDSACKAVEADTAEHIKSDFGNGHVNLESEKIVVTKEEEAPIEHNTPLRLQTLSKEFTEEHPPEPPRTWTLTNVEDGAKEMIREDDAVPDSSKSPEEERTSTPNSDSHSRDSQDQTRRERSRRFVANRKILSPSPPRPRSSNSHSGRKTGRSKSLRSVTTSPERQELSADVKEELEETLTPGSFKSAETPITNGHGPSNVHLAHELRWPLSPRADHELLGGSSRKRKQDICSIVDDGDKDSPVDVHMKVSLLPGLTRVFEKGLEVKDHSEVVNFVPESENKYVERHRHKAFPSQCRYCQKFFLSKKGSRHHVSSHIRLISVRCKLCNAGSLYPRPLLQHLTKGHCREAKGLDLRDPELAVQYMTCVRRNDPGAVMFSSGEIVSSESLVPYIPDAEVEEKLLREVQAAEV